MKLSVPCCFKSAMCLTRRACVDRVETVQRISHRVGLMKLERVMRLWLDIDTHHFKPCAVVAHRCAARTAEKIEQPGFHLPAFTPVIATLKISSAWRLPSPF